MSAWFFTLYQSDLGNLVDGPRVTLFLIICLESCIYYASILHHFGMFCKISWYQLPLIYDVHRARSLVQNYVKVSFRSNV